MEVCPHGDLCDFMIKNGAIKDEILLKQLMLQLCSGINDMHTVAEYAHQDIKLENILIDKDFKLKIIDFGFAMPTSKDIGIHQGTPGYEAPEILNVTSRVGPGHTYRGVQADIFSLGVVFFILKFGVPPFKIAKKDDMNFGLFLRKPDMFWKYHP